MKKHPVNPEGISNSMVWVYRIENKTDSGDKIVLSRRYVDEFVNIFDGFHSRGTKWLDGYEMPLRYELPLYEIS